jgi:hypothetical protein
MPKSRKMLGDWNAPAIQSLVKLIETQSKTTLVNWCVGYAEHNLLPVYAKAYPDDARPKAALCAARDWIAGNIKLPAAKGMILACHEAAREAEGAPAAQAAARAAGQCASTIHSARHCVGLALYGALALAYDRAGTGETWKVYERLAAQECARMEAALLAVAVLNEPNPAKIDWKC